MKSPHWVIILLGALVSSAWADERVPMPQNAVARRIGDFAVIALASPLAVPTAAAQQRWGK